MLAASPTNCRWYFRSSQTAHRCRTPC